MPSTEVAAARNRSSTAMRSSTSSSPIVHTMASAENPVRSATSAIRYVTVGTVRLQADSKVKPLRRPAARRWG